MTKTIKQLNDIHEIILKVIYNVGNLNTKDLNVLEKRLSLLKQLSDVLPTIAELINQLQGETK